MGKREHLAAWLLSAALVSASSPSAAAAARGGASRSVAVNDGGAGVDRDHLKAEANRFAVRAAELYQQLQYDEALRLLQQAEQDLLQLYPPDRYPRGHPDLALVLNNQAAMLNGRGNYEEARQVFERVLAMDRKLYPRDQYPQGHEEIADSLNNLASVTNALGDSDRARTYREEALVIYQRMYPAKKYPQGHPAVALALNNLGFVLYTLGDYVRARQAYDQALAMYQSLFPAAANPSADAKLALVLNNLGMLFTAQGEYKQAVAVFERALPMYEHVYSKNKFPAGHPRLAMVLNNLGGVLKEQGELARARGRFAEALEMNEQLYPKADYPNGHPELALSLNNLAFVAHAQKRDAEAVGYFERALAMYQRLYPTETFPAGHPDLAMTLGNLGDVLGILGRPEPARHRLEDALAIWQRLYPVDIYPHGHADLARAQNSLGYLLASLGRHRESARLLEAAANMRNDLAEQFVAGASESEALNYVAQHLPAPSLLLSEQRRAKADDEAAYGVVLARKGMIFRILGSRQQALLENARPEVQARYRAYLETRRQLAHLMLAPAEASPPRVARRRTQLSELGRRKEELERELSASVPELRDGMQPRAGTVGELRSRLPKGAVLVDLLAYERQEWGVEGRKRTVRSYAAFVVTADRAVERVDLGSAQPIDEAIAAWRKQIASGARESAASTLRARLWAKVERHFPAKTSAVLICPDADTTAVPWSAIPGQKPGSILLDDYAIGTVPNPQILLRAYSRLPDDVGTLLAVGDVNYDAEPEAVDREAPGVRGSAARGGEPLRWTRLPGTKTEIDAIEGVPGGPRIERLADGRASVAAVLANAPKARWLHLATHGFFADASFRSVLNLDEELFGALEAGPGGERSAVGARNPLVLSGLVLAGANRNGPGGAGGVPQQDDGGILAAETIAGMPLQSLELVVLSACETGLGQVAGGEGVFGLERAFHLAGARSVVASLWKVDDAATAALMALFYEFMWKNATSPRLALQQAQLALYHHPDRIPQWAKRRGFEVASDGSATARPAARSTTPTKLWAAFVVSGAD